MTIHTVIEITAQDHHDHERQLRDTLSALGYEPKESRDHINWMRDLYEVLEEQGIDYRKLIEEKQKKRFAERFA